MNEQRALQITEILMKNNGIGIRDTWTGWNGTNLDDYYKNGCYGGLRHFKISYNENIKYCQVKAKKAYSIPKYRHLAYDEYTIQVPDRMKDRLDAIIHESVHFLQASTAEDENGYINFNGNNYKDYISQRTETEAHIIQLIYMAEVEHKNIPLSIMASIKSSSHSEKIKGILSAKESGFC